MSGWRDYWEAPVQPLQEQSVAPAVPPPAQVPSPVQVAAPPPQNEIEVLTRELSKLDEATRRRVMAALAGSPAVASMPAAVPPAAVILENIAAVEPAPSAGPLVTEGGAVAVAAGSMMPPPARSNDGALVRDINAWFRS